MNTKFRFRLTFNHTYKPFFDFDSDSALFSLGNTIAVSLVARDADRLCDAMCFHFDAGGFDDVPAAKAAGEHLRRSLLMLNAALDLRLVVPIEDQQRPQYAQAIKADYLNSHDKVLLDTIMGLFVYPDDGRHVERIVAGHTNNCPDNPRYLFEQLDKIWPIDVELNERSEDALEILNRAVAETSMRTKFLLTYLALDRLIDQPKRSIESQSLITELQDQVESSHLPDDERASLRGALNTLKNQSLKTALKNLLENLSPSPYISGQPAFTFLSKCIEARNSLSHSAGGDGKYNLAHMADEMRAFSLLLILTFNKIEPIILNTPQSRVKFLNLQTRER